MIYSTALGQKRSCETQLTMSVEDLAKNVSTGKQIDLILLDFSKTFDKVNNSERLWKPYQYGIRGTVLVWVRAFLGNRSQTVVLEGEESGSVPVISGFLVGRFWDRPCFSSISMTCRHRCDCLPMTRPCT